MKYVDAKKLIGITKKLYFNDGTVLYVEIVDIKQKFGETSCWVKESKSKCETWFNIKSLDYLGNKRRNVAYNE